MVQHKHSDGDMLIGNSHFQVSRAIWLLFNVAIVCLWLWLFRSIFDNLAIIFTREDFRTNQIALVGVLVLIGLRLKQSIEAHKSIHVPLSVSPHPYAPALALALGGAILFVAVEQFLNVNIIAMALFGLASYGLLGLWMSPRAWREGLPAALLLVGALPLGDFIDVFLGYPMRIATATLVRHGLAASGATSIGIDTILVFENGISQVDLPCSGVKSLWTGALFLIAATWVERRPLNLRWLLIALAFVALLFIANVARVTILVAVGQVFGLQLLAELIHVPLGVLGFVAVCAITVLLLKRIPTHTASIRPEVQPGVARLSPALVVALIALNVLNSPGSVRTASTETTSEWELPPTLNAQLVPLRSGELDWLLQDGAESVTRVRFRWRDIGGSLLLVPSTNWRAHHYPERCFENDGLVIEHGTTHLVNQDMPVRLLTLSSDSHIQRSATYWFQSANRISDDYGTRLWSAVSLHPERWVMVTILFDGVHNPHADDVQALFLALREVVRAYLPAHSTGGNIQ